MILRDKPRLTDLAFALRGSVLPAIIRPLLGLIAISAALTGIGHLHPDLPHVDPAALTTFGLALSLFLGFRNNAAYDRWWEARKLWGGLLADLRSLSREADVCIRGTSLRQAVLKDALAFVHLHRAQLRRIADDPEARAHGADLMGAAHPPCAALDRMSARIAAAGRAGEIDGFGLRTLTGRIGSISLQQAGCERIAGTPLPYVYSLLIYRTAYIYCLILPLGLVSVAGWLTPLIVGVVAYVFLGLAEVSEELSHPFGLTPNGLPLDAICRAAEISLAPHLGQPVPQPLAARGFFLS